MGSEGLRTDTQTVLNAALTRFVPGQFSWGRGSLKAVELFQCRTGSIMGEGKDYLRTDNDDDEDNTNMTLKLRSSSQYARSKTIV